MSLTSKDEYLEASRALATGFGPTVDFTDPQIGSTVQGEGGVPTAASDLPGQVFSVDQLPNPAVAVAYGLPPVTVPAHLILDNEEDSVRHVQGKDALDVLTGQLRENLGDPALAFDNTIRSQDEALGHFNNSTGAGLGSGEMQDAGEPFVDGIKGGDGETTTSTDGIDGPIDTAGVQADPETGKPVSQEAGNQGESVQEAPGGPDSGQPGGPEQQDDKPSEKAGRGRR